MKPALAAQPVPPLVKIESAQPALEELHRRLLELEFQMLERYPWPGGLSRLYFEPAICARWLIGASNCWQASAFASAYSALLHRIHPSLRLLQQAFLLCEPVPAASLENLFSAESCRRWKEAGLLEAVNGSLISRVRATPWRGKIFWHDPPPNFRESFVFCGPDSISFAHHLEAELKRSPGRRYKRALDVCTGSGIHALMLSERADRIVGADLNPRAIAYARLNARLQNRGAIQFILSDLLKQVPSGRYDLVVSNMPLLFLPEPLRSSCLDGNAGRMGIELPLQLLDQLGDRLAENGVALLHVNSAVAGGRDLLTDEIRKRFADRNWLVELRPTHEFYEPAFDAFYREHQIQRFITYVVRIQAGGQGRMRLKHLRLSIPRKAVCTLRIAVVRRLAR